MQKRKKRIGFVVGNYHTDHPSRLVHSIWELLKEEDEELQVFLGTESASFMKDYEMRSNLFDYQYASLCGYTKYEELDALIISAGTLSIYQNDIPLEEFLQHTPDIPTILMETDHVPGNGICLIADNTQGLSSCVEHLITVHGMTRIGFISGPENNKDAEERFIGYRNMLEKHGILFRPEYVAPGDYSEHVDKSVEALLDRAPDLQAIACANDEMTVAVYRVLHKRGLTVGKDIAVTGFDDMLMARFMDPPLTTARQDYDEFSRVAVDSALKMLRGEKVTSRRIKVPFVKRCSCGCMVEELVEDEPARKQKEELIRSMERSREYQHNSWIGSLMNREMLLAADIPKRFFETIGSFMAYLGTASSYLCLFEHPREVTQGTISDFPDRIQVCMRQNGKEYEGYDWDEAPVMYRDLHIDMGEFRADGSYMTFLLFDEQYQYGVLNAAIDPQKIDFYYMLSLDIGTNLRYMEIWTQQKQYRAQLQALARTDSLTGLQNRAGVIQARESMLGRMTRRAGVIALDLDHLKQINDQFGHHEGDEALMAAANILRQVIEGVPADGTNPSASAGQTGGRNLPNGTGQQGGMNPSTAAGQAGGMNPTNAAGQTDGGKQGSDVSQVIGRIGGDEFIACSVGVTQEELEEQVRQIHLLCDQFNEKSKKPYFVEISAGIAVGKVRNMEDWARLTALADAELYEAKKTRRDFVLREVE